VSRGIEPARPLRPHPALERAGIEKIPLKTGPRNTDLRAALKQLEKIRPDRFSDIEAHTRSDVHALLVEIVSRSQYFLDQLGDDPEN